MNALQPYRLSVKQFFIMAVIASHPGMSRAGIAEDTGATLATVREVLADLQVAGLVHCLEDEDRTVYLSEEGRKIFSAAQPKMQELERRITRLAKAPFLTNSLVNLLHALKGQREEIIS